MAEQIRTQISEEVARLIIAGGLGDGLADAFILIAGAVVEIFNGPDASR